MKKILFSLSLMFLLIGTNTSLLAQSFSGETGAVTDDNCAGVFDQFDAVVSGLPDNLGTNINLENVTVNITHSYTGDFQLFLRAPDGSVLELSTGNGVDGDNYTNTVFTDAAAAFITAGAAPFTGTFRPEGKANTVECDPSGTNGSFTFASEFNGIDPNGTWSLLTNDNFGGDLGFINAWTLNFVTCLPPTATLSAAVIEPCTSPGQFNITVDLTSLGNASSVDILNNGGVAPLTNVTAPEMFTFGPFNNGDLIEISIIHNDDSECNIIGYITADDCPPANDECMDAIMFTESTDATCSDAVSGTTLGATISTDNACGGAEEVWYQYTAVSANASFEVSNLVATSAGGTPERGVIAVYTGSCGALTLVAGGCSFAPVCAAVSPGTTYYVAVETRAADGTPTPATFDLCVSPCPTLENDECSDAIPVSQSTSSTCTNSVAGTTLNATASAENSTNCGGATPDVWFTHTAVTTGRLELVVSNFMGDMGSLAPERAVVGLYSGTDCGALTFISCDGLAEGVPVAFSATAGTTYYIAIDTRNADFTLLRPGTFDLCIYPCPLPANDECTGSINIQESTAACENAVSGSTVCATSSTENTCAGRNEVWYNYMAATSTTVTIDATILGDLATEAIISVYTGSCGALTLSTCAFSPLVLDVTSGSLYFISVETVDNNIVNTPAAFDLCINPCAGGPPTNDACDSAATLMESADNSCNNEVSGTTICATSTADNTVSTGEEEVWYAFTATTSADLHTFESVNTTDGSPSTIAVYTGTCGALTFVGSGISPLSLTLTSGTAYTVMVTPLNAEFFPEPDNFTLCVYPSPAPANDDCATATSLNLSNLPIIINDIDASAATVDAAGQPNCVNNVTSGTDIFYSFVGDGTPINIDVVEQSGGDVELSLYSGACDALVCETFIDDPESIADFMTVNGTAYILKIAGFSSTTALGTIDLVITSNALAVELTNFSGYTTDKTNVIEWTTATEIDAKNYIVERSFNGRTAWTKIGTVAATGNSSSALDYSLVDTNPSAIAYYRLISVDINGTSETSNIILLERKGEVSVQVYPVPAQDQVSVDFNGNDGETVLIFISDVAGRLVHQVEMESVSGLNTTIIDINQFANGIYFLTLDNGLTKATNRIIKQ